MISPHKPRLDIDQPLGTLIGDVVPLLLLPMRVVMMSAQALSIRVFEEEQPLTAMGIDVINVACSHGSTLYCTLTAERFRDEPVPSDRLPDW